MWDKIHSLLRLLLHDGYCVTGLQIQETKATEAFIPHLVYGPLILLASVRVTAFAVTDDATCAGTARLTAGHRVANGPSEYRMPCKYLYLCE